MAEYKFGVTGKDRKALVTAISELLNTESQYLGIQKAYAYQIGEDLIVDKEGTAIRELPTDLLEELAERGFQAEIEEVENTTSLETENTDETSEPIAEVDSVCIEMPLDGFTPESLDILCKLVASKEPLIKNALGTDALPIKVLSDKIAFPWFKTTDSDALNAYAQFITALCNTAKTKTRVMAKPQAIYDNEKFSMRIFGIQLGLKGDEYSLCRKLLLKNLTGDSGHRFSKPEDGAPSRKRDGVQREVVSIRLTPETLEKLSILASQAETKTGQRTSRNMLIEQAVEAYVEQAVMEAACLPKAATNALDLADNASAEALADEALAIALLEENAPTEADTTFEETTSSEASDDNASETEDSSMTDIAVNEGEVVGK